MILIIAFQPLSSNICPNVGLAHSLPSGPGVYVKTWQRWPLSHLWPWPAHEILNDQTCFYHCFIRSFPVSPFHPVFTTLCLATLLWLLALDLMSHWVSTSSCVHPCSSSWGSRNLESALKIPCVISREHILVSLENVLTQRSYLTT